jgi:hypothetical protein
MQWVPITCECESRSGEVYSIQHYVIKFVSDLRPVSGFLGTLVSSTNKTDSHDITEKLLKMGLNTITITLTQVHKVFSTIGCNHLASFVYCDINFSQFNLLWNQWAKWNQTRLEWSFTGLIFFMWLEHSRWSQLPIMDSDWLKFYLKLFFSEDTWQNGCYIVGMFFN